MAHLRADETVEVGVMTGDGGHFVWLISRPELRAFHWRSVGDVID